MYFPTSAPQLVPALPTRSAMLMSKDNQLKEALIERTAAYRTTNGYTMPFSTPEMQLVDNLWQAKRLTRRLIRSSISQFSVIRKPVGPVLQATDLGNEIIELFSSFSGQLWEQFPCHLFEPQVELFLECARKRNLTPSWRPFLGMAEAQLLQHVDALNGFAQDVRKRGGTGTFRSKVAAFQAATDHRHNDMTNYFKGLFVNSTVIFSYAIPKSNLPQ